MRVLLFQVDGKLPNLALMRLSTWHKNRGDEVIFSRSLGELTFIEADRVYSSSIFTKSQHRRDVVAQRFPGTIGGGDGYKPIWNNLIAIKRSGVAIPPEGIGSNLREVITDADPNTISPDFSLYPEFNASIGYSMRGCRLDCAFCGMKTREGEARGVSTLRQIWRGEPYPKHLHLLDNDFFGQREWRDLLTEAIEHDFKVCFNQGINIRLVDGEQAEWLSRVHYCDDSFTQRRLYTAWDNLGDERVFKAGVATLAKAGIPARHLMVYMLCGYRKGETIDEVFYRFNELQSLGCEPYPMVFDRSNRELVKFQRWVVRGYAEKRASRGDQPIVPWEVFRKGGPRTWGKEDTSQQNLFGQVLD